MSPFEPYMHHDKKELLFSRITLMYWDPVPWVFNTLKTETKLLLLKTFPSPASHQVLHEGMNYSTPLPDLRETEIRAKLEHYCSTQREVR